MTLRKPDFIGLGAQRSGTSWIYACLYEHPGLCLPLKEVHFFSRERNWSNGHAWYEAVFGDCPKEAKVGEWSTSYLVDPETASRIRSSYPDTRLLVSLRNPVERAFSNYVNDIMAGAVSVDTSFAEALETHREYIENGRYSRYLPAYDDFARRGRLLVLIYEDALRDPAAFIRRIYHFLDVDPDFRPSMLQRRVNEGRIPRSVGMDRWLRRAAGLVNRAGLGKLWWLAKRSGLGSRLRTANTAGEAPTLPPEARAILRTELRAEVSFVEEWLQRDLPDWRGGP